MSVYGIGAYYDQDVTEDFLKQDAFVLDMKKATQQLYMKCCEEQS